MLWKLTVNSAMPTGQQTRQREHPPLNVDPVGEIL